MSGEPDVLTAEECAALLRVSVDTVRREVRAGRLPARRVGREFRFSRRLVLEWLETGGVDDGRYRRRDK